MGKHTAITDVTVCPGCDLILATTPIKVPFGSRLICPRCKRNIHTPIKDTVKRTMALSLTGLFIYIPAHYVILLTFEMVGLQEMASVYDSIKALYLQKYGFVSLAVFLTAQFLPLMKLGLLFLVSFGISQKVYVPLLPRLLRWYQHLEEWGMSEVYLIAILVTIIKMAPTTRITYEFGFICFVWLVIIMSCISCVFDRRYFWTRIEELLQENNLGREKMITDQEKKFQGNRGTTAISAGLLQCHTCHKVLNPPVSSPDHELYCPRCEGRIHWRVVRSVSTTWALVLSALILCFPANILPIMDVELFGVSGKKTIMDGIIYFFQTGSYGIGLVILTASVLVPVFKIVGLSVLLYSINLRRGTRLLHKTLMYRFISYIGRWSMLDVFVIALLCSLVKFGFLTTVEVAPAAIFFTWVVITTMFAAKSFDERLLWDVADLS